MRGKLRSLVVSSTVGSLLAVFLPIALTEVKAATIVFADSLNGDDSTGNGSAGSPYRTFHKAYSVATAGDTINLTGTFTWTDAAETGDVATTGYTLAKNLTIVGQSRATIIQAAATRNTADRMVFFIARGATVTLRNLTVRHGKVVTDDHGGGITLYGEYCGQAGQCAGATGVLTLDQVDVVQNDAGTPLNSYTYDRAGGVMMQENANLTVVGSNIEDNKCICKFYAAGGIYGGMQSATISISNSSVSKNVVVSDGGSSYPYNYTSVAGGLATQRFGKVTITNSTFYGNTTNSYGGAMSLYYQDRGVRLTNVTVVGNSATLGAGGILWNQLYSGNNYDLRMKNVLLADNTGVGGASSDFYAKDGISGNSIVTSYSIIESSTNKTFTGTGIITGNQAALNVDSDIATNSASNGSKSLALLSGSVAIDAGDSAAHGATGNTVTPPSTDQRGFARVGSYDVGAFENGAGTPPTTTTTSTTTTSTTTTTTTTSTTTTLAPATTVSASTTVQGATTTTAASSNRTPTSTTVASSTQTTVAAIPQVLVPQVSTTVASSDAEGGDSSTATSTTNSSSSSSLNSDPSTTTTLSGSRTVTSTTAVSEDEAAVAQSTNAPDAPAVSLGEAASLVGGEQAITLLQRVNDTLVLSVGNLQVVVSAVSSTGEVLPLDVDGNVRLDETRQLQVELENTLPLSTIESWMYSTPTLLGTFTSAIDGSAGETFTVGKEIEDGEHRLVLKQIGADGVEVVMAVGVAIGSLGDSNWTFSRVIMIPLVLAIVAALVIPARRRSRKEELPESQQI